MCCFPEAFILQQSGSNIKSGRPTSKGYNIEADFELKQMWNFKNQETNDKRQRQMMGDERVQSLADDMRATNLCSSIINSISKEYTVHQNKCVQQEPLYFRRPAFTSDV